MALGLTSMGTKISNLGSRPRDGFLRDANLIFFGLTMFFGIMFLVVSSTHETTTGGNPIYVKDHVTTYGIVIIVTAFLLFIMEFYASLNGPLRLARLGAIATLLTFCGLAVPPLIQYARLLSSFVDAVAEKVSFVVPFILGAFTVGFAGIAGTLSALEVFRHANI